MTAEAIVMNKFGVALAADSVIAAHLPTSPKVFNSVDKIFRLSNHQPVALMIYESVEYLGVPWESLIAHYRAQLGDRAFSTVQEHAEHFLDYVSTRKLDADNTSTALLNALAAHYWDLADRVREKISDEEHWAEMSESELSRQTSMHLDSVVGELKEMESLVELANLDHARFVWQHRRTIAMSRDQGFLRNFPVRLDRHMKRTLLGLAALFVQKEVFSSSSTGLVFAGFGTEQMLPSARVYLVEAILPNLVKRKLDIARDVSASNQGIILPFAQTEMVYRFLQGVDPHYENFLTQLHVALTTSISEFMLDQYIPKKRRNEVARLIKDIIDNKVNTIMEVSASYRRAHFSRPIVEAVKNLPRPDLAILSEALVHLTSLRRKMSIDVETVGEPIDVAILSKADGFVWHKRKMQPAASRAY
jgi:hypothetical protein